MAWIQDALLGLEDDGEEEDEGAPAPPSLRMAQAARDGEWAQRDLRALAALLRALREWLDAAELALELRLDPDQNGQSPEERVRELLEWLASVPVPADVRQAAVRFGPLEISRAVTVDHLFVLGLGEGEFPAAASA